MVARRQCAEQTAGPPGHRAGRVVVYVAHFDRQSQIGLTIVKRQDQRDTVAQAYFVLHVQTNAA